MAASKSKTVAYTDSESEGLSDSDTDYEPEPKKSKLDESKAEEKEPDGLIGIPFRGSTTAVIEISNEESRVPPLRLRLSNILNCPEGGGCERFPNESDNTMTVGNIVQRTIDASISTLLQSQPSSQLESSSQREEGSFPPRSGHNDSRAPSGSSNREVVEGMAGEFSTIAREVVGSVRLADQESARLRRTSGNLPSYPIRRTDPSDNNRRNNDSRSSSEYFTDDMDPLEIPSDEYLSPPFPTRQRRNAIFARREPLPPPVENEDDQFYHNELEVASVFDTNENPIEDGSSTSDASEEIFGQAFTPMEPPPPEETDTNFADTEIKSDGESQPAQLLSDSQEPGTSEKPLPGTTDKSLCSQCHAPKPKACFRYCTRCFKIRRTWLPARPASRRLKNRKAQMRSNPTSLNNSINSTQTRSSDSSGEDVVDSGRRQRQVPSASAPTTSVIQRNLPSSQPIDLNDGFIVEDDNPGLDRLSPETPIGNVTLINLFQSPQPPDDLPRSRIPTTSTDVESQSQSQSCSSQSQSQSGSSQSQHSAFSQNSSEGFGSSIQSSSPPLQPEVKATSQPASNTNDVLTSLSSPCSICFVRDKDAAFVHNKIAHLYCCYSCADKILKKNGKCPICRERVLRVVKIISV